MQSLQLKDPYESFFIRGLGIGIESARDLVRINHDLSCWLRDEDKRLPLST